MQKSNSYIRKQKIISQLISKRNIDVNELAKALSVTPATIRNDLTNLEKRGLLIRTHGGAVLSEDETLARNFSNTIQEHTQEKQDIAKEAAKLVNDGDTIIIDAGSTNAILAQYIKDKNITVLTNSIPVIQTLINFSNIEIIVIGGVIRRASLSSIGNFGANILQSFNVDTYFMGATNFDINKGVSNSNIVEGQTKQLMLNSAQKVCFIADSTKGNKSSLFKICSWDEIDIFITESLKDEDKTFLEKNHNIHVKTLNTI
jgi:DeoR family fructose operon transcriptional repressor